MITGLQGTTVALIVVAVLVAVGQILMAVLSIVHAPNDAVLNDFNHTLLAVLVLMLGGKAATTEIKINKNGGGSGGSS